MMLDNPAHVTEFRCLVATKLAPLATEFVPRTIKLLPCLACPRNERALAQTFLACLHGEPPPRPDNRVFRFLPRSCCKQSPIDPESLVA